MVGLVNVPAMPDAPLPGKPPVNPPVTIGADQLNVVPAGITPFTPFVGVVLKATPVQVVSVIAFTAAFGLMVTVTVNVVPAPQLTVLGVTVYVAVCALLVGLFIVPVILAALVPLAPPVIPPVTPGADQLYVVPAGTMPFVPLTGDTVNNTPVQLTVVIAVIATTGLIVTVAVNELPVHPFDNGVTK